MSKIKLTAKGNNCETLKNSTSVTRSRSTEPRLGTERLVESRRKTIRSYAQCLYAWKVTNFGNKFHCRKGALRAHLERIFKNYSLKELPKVFKGLLCDRFSLETGQVRPLVPVTGKKLFPSRFQTKMFHACSGFGSERRTRLFWDLMQSKALAAEVHSSFVKDALLKHRDTVSQVHTTDQELLDSFQEFVRPWARKVASAFREEDGHYPSRHACYEASRNRGGVSSQFEMNSFDLRSPTEPRLDPTTLTLTGPAGCGKSLFQALLSQEAARTLGTPLGSTVYSRNSACTHWDGYSNQPLVMIDDFCQQINKRAAESTEHSEFIILNSSVDYVLPMADLRDKGRKFNSPLVVLSTNLPGEMLARKLNFTQSDLMAIGRRFNYLVEPVDRLWRMDPNKKVSDWQLVQVTPVIQSDSTLGFNRTVLNRAKNIADLVGPTRRVLFEEWNRKLVQYHSLFKDYSTQKIGSHSQSLTCIVPKEKDHNKVKVSPICEPLKVRTITIGTARNHLLKGLQTTMFDCLKSYKVMKPCFTPLYDEEVKVLQEKEGTWLSGDYSSATDGLHLDFFRAGIAVLLSELRTQGASEELLELVDRESSMHTCEYPMDIEPVVQTNGQLMGSLLSFPFLCLANAFTVGTVEKKSLSELDSCLIHGDDLLWRTNQDNISQWSELCPKVGLSLSMGKNYQDPNWGSIDSQLFFNGYRERTGKYTCYHANDEEKIKQLLKKKLDKPLVVALSRNFLKNTPRSIDVSTDFGGLGTEGTPFDVRSRLVAGLKQRKSVASRCEVSRGFRYTLPKVLGVKSSPIPFSLDSDDEESDRILWKDLHQLEKDGWDCSVSYEPLPSTVTVFRKTKDAMLDQLVKQLQKEFAPLIRLKNGIFEHH